MISILFSLWMGVHYQPYVLQTILERAEVSKTPVVLFDIDDTLTDTRHRTFFILKEFLNKPSTQENYPKEVAILKTLNLKHIYYEIDDTFDYYKIQNAAFKNEAKQYWTLRFFSSSYVKIDGEIPGARNYLDKIASRGTFIVYLTGRDEPRMKTGTLEGLTKNGFPLDENTLLLMKPNKEIPDLEYKQKAFERVAQLGEVVGVFENEPANVNAMQTYFEGATAVFVDTQHSKKPALPKEGIAWIKNYK